MTDEDRNDAISFLVPDSPSDGAIFTHGFYMRGRDATRLERITPRNLIAIAAMIVNWVILSRNIELIRHGEKV